MRIIFAVLGVFSLILNVEAQKVVRYDLYVKDTIVNFTGKEKRAIAVNGQIPMPTLHFTEGDTAEIYVHNGLKESTSLHWHGIFLPNQEDGVPYLTQMPIKPNTTHVYRFAVIQHGTHWYHSHSGLQEQIGMYGSMILEKRKDDPKFRKGIDDLPTIPVVLSEWTDMKPDNVHRYLHNASDWFAIKKGTTQSYSEAIRAGHFGTKVTNEWKRMLAMDVSDVYYNRFLNNGLVESQHPQFKAGDKVRLRISNGGASTYFWLTYSGGKITVVATDGNDVEPVEVDRLIISVSETYDVIVSIPEANTEYEFLMTAEDRTSSTSLFLGSGTKKRATPLPKLKYFAGMKMMNEMMRMNGDLDDMGMKMSLNQMDMNAVMYPEISGEAETKKTKKNAAAEMHHDHAGHMQKEESTEISTLNYAMLASTGKTNLPDSVSVKELYFELTGNMNRYVWSMDNKVISESDKILIRKGENVRMIIYNNSMMRHPMHLHGHDFRVLNGKGDFAPMKNVIDIMPMETDTLEFNANAEGDWFFHCHILYHMMSGMGRIFTYENQAPNPLIPNPALARRKLFADDRKFHFMIANDFATNGNDGMVMIQNTRWSIGSEWRIGYTKEHGFEADAHLGRYFGKMQWLMPFVGADWKEREMEMHDEEENIFGQSGAEKNGVRGTLGVNYTLPMLIVAQAKVFHDGDVRFQLMREDIPVSKRLRAGFMVNTDMEYMVELHYIINRFMGVRTHYDSDMGFGVGVMLNY